MLKSFFSGNVSHTVKYARKECSPTFSRVQEGQTLKNQKILFALRLEASLLPFDNSSHVKLTERLSNVSYNFLSSFNFHVKI